MEHSQAYRENKDAFISALEAVLFAAGEAVSFARISELFEISSDEAKLLAQALATELKEDGRAFEVFLTEDAAGLCTRKEYAPYVSAYLEIKRNVPLSKAALEALAVVAYQQPTTKGYIEKVRGVDCSAIINSLLQRDLVEECGRMDAPGRPILYRTTAAFLRCFGLSSPDELPTLEEHLQQTLSEAQDG